MEYDKDFFEKIFSTARTRKYFALYPHDESKAIIHYECNIKLSESFYPSMSILEVALRNALARELETYITAELTLGFWTSLLNRNYERILWKDLRRAFAFMPKKLRQRKVIAAYLNRFRHLRNRIDHNEPICWNVKRAEELHEDLLQVMAWINKGIPSWESKLDNFDNVCSEIKKELL